MTRPTYSWRRREADLRHAEEEKRKIQLSVPGIINPHDMPEEMQD